jgi:hypothetical protein
MPIGIGQTATFKLDDTPTPGFAKVKLLGQTKVMGIQGWRVEVIEIIRPSQFRKLKVGRKLVVAEKHLSGIEGER